MVKLEITQKEFDTILAALWNTKVQIALSSGTGVMSLAYVDTINLMARIGNQRDNQIREQALLEQKEAATR